MQEEEEYEEEALPSDDDDDFEERDDDDDDDDDDPMELSPTNNVPASIVRNAVIRPTSALRLPPHIADYRELGDEATWTLSSAKSGNGAEALRNGETQTYWQSDGSHPHTVTIQFHRRAALLELAIYCNVRLDESYTPKRIRIMSGTTLRDLEVVVEVELENPEGWVMVGLSDPATGRPLRTFTIQIQCISMHQNGRDTHVRAIRLFGPRTTSADDQSAPNRYSVSKPFPSSRPPQSTSQVLFNFSNIR